ncbi:unnamed protein product [Alternaria alternata]
MEKYTANTRFCIITNYTHKLSEALLSKFTRYRFSPLKDQDIRNLVDKVIEEKEGSMHTKCHRLTCPSATHEATPLQTPGKPAPDLSTIVRDQITQTTIYDCIAAPHPSDIKYIIETLL